MTDNQVRNSLKNVKGFKGVISHDQLQKLDENSSYVLNLDRKYLRGGTHWVCVMNYPNSGTLYFDSFGFAPTDEVLKVMKQTGKQTRYNSSMLQRLSDKNCGWWCVYMIREVALEKDPYKILYEFDQMPTKRNFDLLRSKFMK